MIERSLFELIWILGSPAAGHCTMHRIFVLLRYTAAVQPTSMQHYVDISKRLHKAFFMNVFVSSFYRLDFLLKV